MSQTDKAVARVREGLESGALTSGDLTARRLAEYLGGTTSLLYHHFGSLDGFLRAVSDDAFDRFESSLSGFEARAATIDTFRVFAGNYISFAFERPTLYNLMFSRHLPANEPPSSVRGTERRTPRGRVLRALVTQFRRAGSVSAKDDARLFHGSLHGLVALGTTPRRDDPTDAKEQALASATRLVEALL